MARLTSPGKNLTLHFPIKIDFGEILLGELKWSQFNNNGNNNLIELISGQNGFSRLKTGRTYREQKTWFRKAGKPSLGAAFSLSL